MSATASDDVESLKKLYLHNLYILTLPEVDGEDEVVPKRVQQFWGFNAGLFDYLIAMDDSDSKEKEQTDGDNLGERKKSKKQKKRKPDSEFGVVRGIDLKNVHMDMYIELGELEEHIIRVNLFQLFLLKRWRYLKKLNCFWEKMKIMTSHLLLPFHFWRRMQWSFYVKGLRILQGV